jgi:hypothetical protein
MSVPIAITSLRVYGATKPPCFLKYPLMPAMYASTSLISRLLGEPHLRREERLRLRARHERAPGQRDRERVVAGNVEGGDARRPAQHLEVEPAILRRDPAGAELGVRTRRAVHVRDAPTVAVDRDAAPRFRRARYRLAAEAERLGFVEALQVGGRDVSLQRREAVVERNLVAEVRVVRRLARRKDVQREKGAVARPRGGGGRSERCRCERDEGERSPHRRRDY